MNYIEEHDCYEPFVQPAVYDQILAADAQFCAICERLDEQTKELAELTTTVEKHISDTTVHVNSEEEQSTDDLAELATYVSKSELDNYYTKDQIDSKEYLTSIPDYYITENELNIILDNRGLYGEDIQLDNYYTKDNVDFILENYYTKQQIDTVGYITAAALYNYYTKDQVDSLISENHTVDVSYDTNIRATDTGAYRLGTLNVGEQQYHIYGWQSTNSNSGTGTDTQPTTDTVVNGHYVIVYKQSASSPDRPVGGTYNFTKNVFLAPKGWTQLLDQLTGSQKVWFSTNYFYSDGTDAGWSTPVQYITAQSIITQVTKTTSYPVTIYCQYDGEGAVNKPNTSSTVFDVNTNTLNLPIYSRSTTNTTVTWQDTPSGLTGTIWVSHNNYLISDGVYADETGWTTPKKYYDIDTIIEDAKNSANIEYEKQLEDDQAQINEIIADANDKLTKAQEELNKAQELLNSIETEGGDTGAILTKQSEILGQIETYGWKAFYQVKCSNWRVGTVNGSKLVTQGTQPEPPTAAYLQTPYSITTGNGGEYYYELVRLDGSTDINTDITATYYMRHVNKSLRNMGGSVHYVSGEYEIISDGVTSNQSTLLVCDGIVTAQSVNYVQTLFDALEGRYNISAGQSDIESDTYKEGIAHIAYDKILLELSSVNTKYDTIKDALLSLTESGIDARVYEFQQDIDDINNKIANSTTFSMTPEQILLRALSATGGDTVETAFLKIIKDNISLGVNGAQISLNVGDETTGGTVTIDAGEVVVTGDMIVDAIQTHGININNTTYLNNDGSVYIAQGTNGDSKFEIDGTGYLAGGLINWSKINGNTQLSVKGIIDATAGTIGGWTIGNNSLYTNGTAYSFSFPQNGTNRTISLKEGETTTLSYYKPGTTEVYQQGVAQCVIIGNKSYLQLIDSHAQSLYRIYGIMYVGLNSSSPYYPFADSISGAVITGTQLSSGERMIVSPSSIYTLSDDTVAWQFNLDGSGHIANGAITWTSNGKVTINSDVDIKATTTVNTQDVINTLNANDITVGGGTSKFYADGSGFVANENIAWDKNGKLTITNAVASGIYHNNATHINASNFYEYVQEYENMGTVNSAYGTGYVLDVTKCGNAVFIDSLPGSVPAGVTIYLPKMICLGNNDTRWKVLHGGLSKDDIYSLIQKDLTICLTASTFVQIVCSNIPYDDSTQQYVPIGTDNNITETNINYTAILRGNGATVLIKYILGECIAGNTVGLSVFPQWRGQYANTVQTYSGTW